HHERLAKGAQKDVPRLEIAMEHAPAMRVGDRVAHVEEARQESAEFQRMTERIRASLCSAIRCIRGTAQSMKPRDHLLEALPAHEPHCIERPAIRMMAQAVDRHDSGMLQATGDLCFKQKPRTGLTFAGVPLLDFLESHLAVQLFVERHGNDTQATLSM